MGPVDLSDARQAVGARAASGHRRLPRCWCETLVFPAAVLAVHQLCYLLAFGSRAGSQLSADGDQYVAAAPLIAGVLVLISAGVGLIRLAASRGRGSPEGARAPLWLRWLWFTVLLLVGFCALEGLEMAFEPHHAGGFVGIFGDGGLWALPAAAFVGAVMTLLWRGGRALLALAARQQVSHRASLLSPRRRAASRSTPPPRPMASCAAGRAPPLIQML